MTQPKGKGRLSLSSDFLVFWVDLVTVYSCPSSFLLGTTVTEAVH